MRPELTVRTGAVALPLPDGWEDRTVATLAGPAENGIAPNVVVTRERLCDHLGLGAFADGWVARLRDEVPVTVLRPAEHLEVDGRRAQLRAVSWQAAGLSIAQLAALVVAGDHGYAIVGTAAAASLPAFEPVFREVLAGVRLAGGDEAAA